MMLITFQRCQVYNKVFFHNLNKLAFYPSVIILLPVGLFSILQVLGACRTDQFHKPAYHSFFDRPSFWRFWNFCKRKLSSSNDALNRSMCMNSSPKAFHFAFLSSYHLIKLLWIFG
jgi:hypothetical protein